MKKRVRLLIGFIISTFTALFSQSTTVSGYVRDSQTGEIIIDASIYQPATKTIARSNSFGFYSLSVPKQDSIVLFCGFIGYLRNTIILYPKEASIKHDFNLIAGNVLNEVVVTDSQNVHKENKVSVVKLSVEQIKKLPSLGGEADVLRSYQLMPGVQSGKEGTSGLYIRGGSPDQNLFLMDDIPLYYVNHIGGFVSIFDINSINDITLYKAGFPARYGGRLSSVMDIRLKDGNNQKIKKTYTFGLLSNKLSFEGPLKKDKTTFLITGRRSLFDLFTRLISRMQSSGKYGAGYTFYDITGKITHKINDKNTLYLSGYGGGDNIFIRSHDNVRAFNGKPYFYRYQGSIKWGNYLGALRWNHVFSPKLFSNTTLGYTQFYYKNVLNAVEKDSATKNVTRRYNASFRSSVSDCILKSDYFFYANPQHTIRFGAEAVTHFFNPGINIQKIQDSAAANSISSSDNFKKNGIDLKMYIEDDYKINSKLSANAGLHFNLYALDSIILPSIQPRLLLNYLPFETFSVKAAYSSMQQNLHLLSNSGAGLPTDLWVPATAKTLPEQSNQYVIAFTKTLSSKAGIELSVETYYKTLSHLIELKEGESFFSTATTWENKIEANGKGSIMGAELLLEKKRGKITGWIGYTLSKNTRQFQNLNNGNPFPYRYDRTHDASLVINYAINDHFSLTATWVFSTGQAITMPVMNYSVLADNNYYSNGPVGYVPQEIHVYTERNGYRMPNYHRMDFGFNHKKKVRRGERVWSISIYNVYNRQNPYFLFFDTVDKQRGLYQLSLFPIIPSFSYSYYF